MNKAERSLLSVIALLLVVGGASRFWFSAAESDPLWEPTTAQELSEEGGGAWGIAEKDGDIDSFVATDSDTKKVAVKKSRRRSTSKHPLPLRSGEQINVNTATSKQLQRLPGIGPSLAERIVTYRAEHGSFEGPDALLNVKGIGKTRLDSLRSRVNFHK